MRRGQGFAVMLIIHSVCCRYWCSFGPENYGEGGEVKKKLKKQKRNGPVRDGFLDLSSPIYGDISL